VLEVTQEVVEAFKLDATDRDRRLSLLRDRSSARARAEGVMQAVLPSPSASLTYPDSQCPQVLAVVPQSRRLRAEQLTGSVEQSTRLRIELAKAEACLREFTLVLPALALRLSRSKDTRALLAT